MENRRRRSFLNEAWEARDIITDAKESGDNTELKDYAKEKNMTIAEVKKMANCVDSSFNSSSIQLLPILL